MAECGGDGVDDLGCLHRHKLTAIGPICNLSKLSIHGNAYDGIML